MSASTDSSFVFNRVLSDTFGPVKYKQEHPEYVEDATNTDLDTFSDQNPYINSAYIPDETIDGTSHPVRDTVDAGDGLIIQQAPGGETDTTGVLRRTRDTGEVSNPALAIGEAEGSSSHSSFAELTAAQERGIRTSFREPDTGLQNPGVQVDDTAVKVVDVHVRGVPGDIENETPASIASSNSRFFLTRSGQHRDFTVGNLQQNTSLAATMRGVIRNENHDQEMDTLTSPANGHVLRSGNEKIPMDYGRLPEKETYCCPKLMVFLVALMVIVGGIFVAVYFLKEDHPDKQTGGVIQKPEEKPVAEVCSKLDVKLRDGINLTCLIKAGIYISPKMLHLTPPAYYNKGQTLKLGLDPKTTEFGWSAEFNAVRQLLSIRGPSALCSSDGDYQLQLLNSRNVSVYNTSITINVLSEVLKVNVSLSQSITDNSTDFTVACRTNSGCEQSFVDFFADINKKEQYLKGVNFTCIIDYNDYDGYSVSCSGVIPDYLMSQFGRITCRPRSRFLDEEETEDLGEYLELPDCDLTQHCGFKCKQQGDYFTVDKGRCDIFHRCYAMQPYTSYCAPGTFFDPTECTCRHTSELDWCQDNGAVKSGSTVPDRNCTSKTK